MSLFKKPNVKESGKQLTVTIDLDDLIEKLQRVKESDTRLYTSVTPEETFLFALARRLADGVWDQHKFELMAKIDFTNLEDVLKVVVLKAVAKKVVRDDY